MNAISNQNDKKARLNTFEKKLKKIQDETEKQVQEKLGKKLDSVSQSAYMPDDFATYLLSLKQEHHLPSSLLPESFFKKPAFSGREKFFHRLASELITFGLAYQRVYLQPAQTDKIAALFHEHRPWWQCDIHDIKKALNTLVKHSIIKLTSDGFLFEPLTMSTDIHNFLKAINSKINDFGEISLTQILELVPWEKTKIYTIIDLLSSNKVCIFNKNQNQLFFPEFKRG